MPIYRGLVTIKRAGRYHPPGSLHDFDEDTAKALGPSRVVLAEDQTATVVAVTGSAGDATSDAPPAVVVPPASEQSGGASVRVSEISAAIDLLDEKKDYFKSGPRVGKPKQKAIEEIVGFDINDAEIDAALALRETGL
ncbi:hypothetical protein [Bradyrhizobium retamae]|uniref:Uncharacterized protein n=1 Tax=Bradyrhizobium retamae TaxID=1300035 RepID=A0A0R3MN20_9BRAD|nr:hypothetical protein [Bradyrhizobium retamae]KRR21704.1 hypothetical protein CQ13_06540 [Bradyrhizobium retamae]